MIFEDKRPVLVGMNNPLHDDPKYALFPAPVGVTGYRIWEMLHERTGASRHSYLLAFDRRNVLDSRTWDRTAAREGAQAMWPTLAGRTVMFLGKDVLGVFRLPRSAEPLAWQVEEPNFYGDVGPARWCYMPHPSGLNRWYNNPANWAAASLRLEQLYEESGYA